MLEQDYLTWSQQMKTLLKGERGEWAEPWLALCRELDPDAPADEQQLAAIAQAYTDYLHRCKAAGFHFIQPGRFVLPGDMAGAPAAIFPVYLRPDARPVPARQSGEKQCARHAARPLSILL